MSNGDLDRTISETIEKIATSGVQSTSEADKQITMVSIDDLLKAKKDIEANKSKAPPFGIYLARQIPPGTG